MDNIYNLKPKQEIFHPVSLHKIINTTKSDICLTKFKINDKEPNKISEFKYNYKCVYNLDNYNKYMHIPPIGISYTDILTLYNINDIDSLIEWMKSNDGINSYTLKRVINCWIKNNLNLIKKHNKILNKINNNLFNKYELEKIDFNKFVSLWLKKNDDIFNLNYVDDIKIYIKNLIKTKKYSKK